MIVIIKDVDLNAKRNQSTDFSLRWTSSLSEASPRAISYSKAILKSDGIHISQHEDDLFPQVKT